MELVNGADVDRGTEGERALLLVTYILHGLCFTLITTLAAVIINYVKIRETQSAFIRSHHRWLLRTFWWGLLGLALCGLMFFSAFFSLFLGPGALGAFGLGPIAFIALGVWWLYRVIYGAIHFFEGRPMPVPA
jgi:uncharacterized membrane protein